MRIKKVYLLILAAIFIAFGTYLNQRQGLVSPEKNTTAPTVAQPRISPTSAPQDVKGEQISTTAAAQTFLVTRIVDGDTIEIEGKKKVRYIGVNTPETKDPRRGVQCFGKEASEKNKELVEGKRVRLRKDVSETDKFGRLLRYVFLAREDGSELFVNEYLVREGYAYASAYPPDVNYQELFNQAQAEARENSRGLWGQCSR